MNDVQFIEFCNLLDELEASHDRIVALNDSVKVREQHGI